MRRPLTSRRNCCASWASARPSSPRTAFRCPERRDTATGGKRSARDLADAVTPAEYAALQRATQYAHYTPESVVRALWHAAQRLGFAGGRVLEPGMGTGLFFALLPDALRGAAQLTGIEYDPVTARIARLIHPGSPRPLRGLHPQQSRRRLRPGDRQSAVRGPHRPCRSHHVRARLAAARLLHRPLDRPPPAGWHRAVRQQHRHDGQGQHRGARAHRKPRRPGRRRAPAGGRHARDGRHRGGHRRAGVPAPCGRPGAVGAAWTNLVEIAVDGGEADAGEEAESDASLPDAQSAPRSWAMPSAGTCAAASCRSTSISPSIPRWCSARTHSGAASTVPGSAYTCRPRPGAAPVETLLTEALDRLPSAIVTPSAEPTLTDDEDDPAVSAGTAADGATIKEGSFFIGKGGRLSQIVNGRPVVVAIRQGKSGEGITIRAAKVIRALLPIRDAIRDVLRAQAADRPWAAGAGPSPRRLFRLHPLLRADQPHRDHHGHRPGDRRRAGDAPAAQPLAFRRRSGLLAGRQHRELRRRDGSRPQGTDLLRAGDRAAGRAADHVRSRRARRHPERDRARRSRPPGRPAGARPRRPRSPSSAPPSSATRRRRSGRPPTPTSPAPVRTRLAVAEAAADARSAIRAQRHRAARRPAEGHQPVRHHRAARRSLDSDRRHRGLCCAR